MFYWRWFNRPHHPLVRVLIGAFGLALMAGVLMLGLFALIAFGVIGVIVAIVRSLAGKPSRTAPRARRDNALEGEFVVLPGRKASIER